MNTLLLGGEAHGTVLDLPFEDDGVDVFYVDLPPKVVTVKGVAFMESSHRQARYERGEPYVLFPPEGRPYKHSMYLPVLVDDESTECLDYLPLILYLVMTGEIKPIELKR